MNKMWQYISQVRSELLSVTWPSSEQTMKMTGLVIAISLMVAIYLMGLDLVFSKLIGIILNS